MSYNPIKFKGVHEDDENENEEEDDDIEILLSDSTHSISSHSILDSNLSSNPSSSSSHSITKSSNHSSLTSPSKSSELTWFHMSYTLISRALPMTLTYTLGNVANFIMLYFAGHLSKNSDETDTFAGVSMSILFSNISCLSILVGMTGAVETLGSQNFGAKNYQEVGIVLQRSILITSLLVFPVILAWYHVEDIFLLLGVSPSICSVMKHFLRIRALAIPSEVISQSYQKYLMSIGVTFPSLCGTISLITFVFLFNFIFTRHFHWGYTSLAWGFVISKILCDGLIILVSLTEKSVQLTLQPFHMDAFKKWGEYISLGLPGCAMLCCEWWAFEILCIFASQIGSDEVAAQTIIGQLSALAFMIPLGIGVSTSSLVGKYIGSGDLSVALRYAYVALGCLVCVEAVIASSIFFFSAYFVGVFTTSPKVISICVHVSHIVALFTMADGMQGVLSGVFRGAGQQSYGAIINVVSYYAIGLPLAWYLTFKTSMGVAGLMTGISAAVCSQAIILSTLLLFRQQSLFSSVLQSDREIEMNPKKKISAEYCGEYDDDMDCSSHNMIPKGGNDSEDEDPDDLESSIVRGDGHSVSI